MGVWKCYLVFQTLILSGFLNVVSCECLNSTEIYCPVECCCEWIKPHRPSAADSETLKADCSRRNLTSVPAGLSEQTTELNLSDNPLFTLPAGAFSHLPALKELVISNSGIEILDPGVLEGLEELQELKLQLNSLKEVPQIFHQGLKKLLHLYLDDNQIEAVHPKSFQFIPYLRVLSLDGNRLSSIPTGALALCSNLQRLRLGSNRIVEIPDYAFENNTNLINLILSKNAIDKLQENSFAELTKLTELAITGNPITSVARRAFANLPALEELMLSSVKNLEEFPDLEGTSNLDRIILDRCSISTVPGDLCQRVPYLRKLDLHSNALTTIPCLSGCSKLANLHLGVNKISSLEGQPFRGLSAILDLTLKSNHITKIPADAFVNLTQLEYLDLSNNMIEEIHADAFDHFEQLQNLNLAYNRFPHLPSRGLKNLIILQTAHNERLHEIPSPKQMPAIERVVTAYPYHCCEYVGSMIAGGQPAVNNEVNETHYWLGADELDFFFSNSGGTSDYNQSVGDVYDFKSYYGSYDDFDPVLPFFLSSPSFSSDYSEVIMITGPLPIRNISCIPQPDPFMPCSDLFGSWYLRVGVWLVFLLALIGNGIVISVIVFSRTKIDVSRFLICNLACADFAMGIYLGFLAGVDASTLGVFRKYGVDWQLSEGCGVASFLAVFSSELSIFTLCVITLERFYAIKHALHLEKRLKLQHAMVIMCLGWVFAIVAASLPIFGVNRYYRYAVCLPFDISTTGAKAYISGLMLLNGFAFIIIMACYISIYCAIQGSHAWNCNDSRVARRMSLLVFTDFACWAPIAFFGLTSAFKLDLISLYWAKVLTVFVLPVNSCANPFLYTILTKQFKKDCRVILQWVNTKSCTRRNSRSVTLSLARQASIRSTMQHQMSQNRWRTSGSGSQDVGVVDPEKLAHKKTDLELVNEKPGCEQSCIIPNGNGVPVSGFTAPISLDLKSNCYVYDQSTCNGRSEEVRRSSTSPLLEQPPASKPDNKSENKIDDKKRKRKFSVPLWLQKRMARQADLPEEPSQNDHDSQKQPRRFSFTEGIFGRRKSYNGEEDEKKASSEPSSQTKNENNYVLDFSKPGSNRTSVASEKSVESYKKQDRCERRSPCSPKRLWRQRSPVLKRGADASEIQGLLDRRESSDMMSPTDKSLICTVSLKVTLTKKEQQSPELTSSNHSVQRPNQLNLNWKSADTLDSGAMTGSPSSMMEQTQYPSSNSDDSTPITVTPKQSRPTSVSSLGQYPKILVTRLDSFSNVLPDSPTETQRRLDKSRESVV
ncbi:uncharacterized protein [Amphiura filiformis]|uniref:uncharacterized protein n=1 Tax=Amphiura filiformis TaxID=82378 RepID=UPI003B210287